MTNFVTKFNDAERRAYDAIDMLDSAARALRRVGNPVADEIFVAIKILDQSQKEMSSAVNEELSRQVKQADRHIAEVLLGTLKALDGKSEVAR